MAVLRMAHLNNGNSSTGTGQQQLVNPVFHDFLGTKKPARSPLVSAPQPPDLRLSDASPSSGGAHGPVSTTSGMGSERQAGNHLEGLPFYGLRSDITGTEISHRLLGSKRSTSDSTFMGSSRDGFPQVISDSLQNSHLMKILQNAAGGERHRRFDDDEVYHGMQPMMPTSGSLIFQPPAGNKTDGSISKWERSIILNAAPAMPQPSQGCQFAPFKHRAASNKFRDANVGPSFISQLAADEGSRTGVKGPSILSTLNAATAPAFDKAPSGVLSSSKLKSGINILETESSTPPSQHGFTSPSRQMTIFYGGEAHVFEDVHPNKADIIMALAGSNGGSWSTTTYSRSSSSKPVYESSMLRGENETGFLNKTTCHGRLSTLGNHSHAAGSADRVSTPAGERQCKRYESPNSTT